MKAPLPPNESARLHTLRLYEILDTAAEQIFDDLTRLAAAICDTPISLISLLDEERQWFKARVGLGPSETSRDVAFCAHAILADEVMIVEDATMDARFAQNPLVVADPSIRFYAGAPLIVADGLSLGTLCVIDRRPRQLTAAQQDALMVLRQAVVTQLNLRRAQTVIRAMERLLPMCEWCHSVRMDDGTWRRVHEYLAESVPVTRSVCPDCAASLHLPYCAQTQSS